MVLAVARFVLAMANEPAPVFGSTESHAGHWLSLLGTSGTGKTMLAERVWQWFRKAGQFYECPIAKFQGVRVGRFLRWKKFVESSKPSLSAGQWEDLREAWLVVVDDFGAARDPNGYASDLLYGLMEERREKWTLLTANLTTEQVAETLDTRIASRLVRHGGIVVEVDAPDYNAR